MDAADALRQFRVLLAAEVAAAAPRCASSYLERSDLKAIGQMAIVEAVRSYDPARGTLRSRVRFVVRCRLRDALRAARSREVLDLDVSTVPNGRSPEALLERLDEVLGLHRAIGQLPPRQRLIIADQITGETTRQTGKSLGISHTRVVQERKIAHQRLRRALADDGEDA